MSVRQALGWTVDLAEPTPLAMNDLETFAGSWYNSIGGVQLDIQGIELGQLIRSIVVRRLPSAPT